MLVSIIDYTPEVYGEHQLGYIRALITLSSSDKFQLLCKLCKTKEGRKFISFTSIKIAGVWHESISFDSKETDRQLKEQIMKALQAHMSPQPQKGAAYTPPQTQSASVDTDQDLPF